MPTFPKPYADAVARLRVPAGFALTAAFLWFSNPTLNSLAWGVPVSLAGLAIRAWAAGHLEKNQRLATSGPFAWVRNPLYAGSLLVASGLVGAAREWVLAAAFAAAFIFLYLPVIGLEEQHLRKLFPEYEDYARRVRSLVPRPPREASAGRFRWALYRRNREYEAFAAFAVALAVLVWKAR
ncbi:MAG: isoprenylcysteine carboxylmethyltransferase family protein [Bryobacterales bacterium]|jgi:protein-S-isoprenylcysteine O-methyltransferase Ste14|nr:isoprenylcysteine carboxylmethyltransferase family protein [Bryobacterales bacterium]